MDLEMILHYAMKCLLDTSVRTGSVPVLLVFGTLPTFSLTNKLGRDQRQLRLKVQNSKRALSTYQGGVTIFYNNQGKYISFRRVSHQNKGQGSSIK